MSSYYRGAQDGSLQKGAAVKGKKEKKVVVVMVVLMPFKNKMFLFEMPLDRRYLKNLMDFTVFALGVVSPSDVPETRAKRWATIRARISSSSSSPSSCSFTVGEVRR